MRRYRFADVGITSTLAGEQIDKFGEDPPAATDPMFLHDDRQDVTLLIEIRELFAEPEKSLVGDRRNSQCDAVYARRVRSVSRDSEP